MQVGALDMDLMMSLTALARVVKPCQAQQAYRWLPTLTL